MALPPVPYKSQVVDPRSGLLTRAWEGFYKEMFLRLGGSEAASISELQDDVTALDTLTASHTSTLATHTSQISALQTTSKKFMVPSTGIAKVGATAGWVVAGALNTSLVTLPASQTGSTLVIPIPGLKVGMTITAFHLVGQIESAGASVTVDADLRKHTAAAADVTDASVGAITQLAVTADTIMSESNTNKGSLVEVIAADETFYILITATTAASTDIALQGVAVTVTEVA